MCDLLNYITWYAYDGGTSTSWISSLVWVMSAMPAEFLLSVVQNISFYLLVLVLCLALHCMPDKNEPGSAMRTGTWLCCWLIHTGTFGLCLMHGWSLVKLLAPSLCHVSISVLFSSSSEVILATLLSSLENSRCCYDTCTMIWSQANRVNPRYRNELGQPGWAGLTLTRPSGAVEAV